MRGTTVHPEDKPQEKWYGREVVVPYWDWYDEGNHQVRATEVRDGEAVLVEIDGALGKQSFEISMQAASALSASLMQLMVPTPEAPAAP